MIRKGKWYMARERGRRRRRRVHSQPVAGRPAEAEIGAATSSGRLARYMRLLVGCLLIALLIAGVVAWWQPVDSARSVWQSVPLQATIELAVQPVAATAEEMEAELVRLAERMQTRFPESAEALHVAAVAYAELRQTRKAEQIWQRCIALAPDRLGPRVGMASTAIERGEDETAVAVLRDALDRGLASPELYYHLATALNKLGRIEQAEEVLQEGLGRFEPVAVNWRLLGQAQLQLARYEEAESSLRRARSLGDESAELYLALANGLSRQGKSEEAEAYRELFRQRRAIPPEDADQPFQEAYAAAMRRNLVASLAKAGAVFAHEGDLEEAERLLLRAVELDPRNAEILREVARMFLDQRRLHDAWLVHRQLVQFDPPNFLDCINLAHVGLQVGDHETVERGFRLAMDLRPEIALPYVGLAQLYVETGQFEQARWLAEGAVRREPTIQAYAVLAAACEGLNDLAAAGAAREAAEQLAVRAAADGSPSGPAVQPSEASRGP